MATQTEIARTLGSTNSTISAWVKRGMPTTSVSAAMDWHAENIRTRRKRTPQAEAAAKAATAPPDDGDDVSSLSWRARRDRADALKAEIGAKRASTALDRERGKLVEVSRLSMILADISRQWASICDSVPVRLKRRVPDLPPAALRIIEEELDRARNLVAEITPEVEA